MTILYSVIPGDAIVFPLGATLDGWGKVAEVRWDRLDCTDCAWMVPGTEDANGTD